MPRQAVGARTALQQPLPNGAIRTSESILLDRATVALMVCPTISHSAAPVCISTPDAGSGRALRMGTSLVRGPFGGRSCHPTLEIRCDFS